MKQETILYNIGLNIFFPFLQFWYFFLFLFLQKNVLIL